MVKCARCQQDTLSTIMSMFNTEEICLECKTKEQAHPDYQRAIDIERAEVKAGNMNFPGIGKPKDL